MQIFLSSNFPVIEVRLNKVCISLRTFHVHLNGKWGSLDETTSTARLELRWTAMTGGSHKVRWVDFTNLRRKETMQSKTKSTYMVVRHGRSFGPYSASQLRQFASAKQLFLDDLICRVGTPLRTRVRKIEGLSCLIHHEEGTAMNQVSDKNVQVKPVSALLTAVRSYRQWRACRRALADISNYCKTADEIEPLLATEIASRDEFTQSICKLFPV